MTDPSDQSGPTPPPTSPDAGDPQPQLAQQQQQQDTLTPQGTQPQSQSQAEQSAAGMVSNTPATATPAASVTHPEVQKASLLHTIAQTLAGGPRYKTSIDANSGITTRTQLPLSKADVGMAIAMSAISGALSGLSITGPGATGKAAAAGFATATQAAQQQQAQQQQQAKDDLQNQTATLAAKAQAFDFNSRSILNVSQSERYGLENLKDAVQQNARLLADYSDAGAVSQTNVSQDSLMAGLKDGTYSATSQIAVPDGFTSVNGRFEQTFSVVKNPSAKVPLTATQVAEFVDNNIPGFAAFKSGTKIAANVSVPGTIVARATAQVTANKLMLQEVGEVTKTLSESDDPANKELAKAVPSFKSLIADPQSGPSVQDALSRFQKFVSHSDLHGLDFFQSLQQMASPSKADPQNPKQMVPNRDAPFAATIAGAFGNGDPQKGWAILQKYSEEIAPQEIKSEAQAADMIASSEPGSRSYRYAQRWIASNTAQKAASAGAIERARDAASPSNSGNSNSSPSGSPLTKPDAFGFNPTITDPKEASKRFGAFKKNLDDLSKTEQSYAQFQNALSDISKGNWSGADSVVALFSAIGLSAAPLAGKGFRVSQNVIEEHRTARGWQGALQAKMQGLQTGAVITPQQLKDYAGIAASARTNQYVSTGNEMRSAGISADAALPSGNGQHIDPNTASIFLRLANGDKSKARQAATAKGWNF